MAYLKILLALVAILVTILVARIVLLKRPSGKVLRDVLIVGPQNAGKTALFYLLRSGNFLPTQPSMTSNTCSIPENLIQSTRQVKGKLLDFPGHPKLAHHVMSAIDTSRCIIFTIDSTTFSKDFRSTSEYLYNILTNATVQTQKIPVLVACNKSDMPNSVSMDRIKATLQKEINQIRMTSVAAVDMENDSTAHDFLYLGKEGKPFEFNDLCNRVDFINCSIKNADVQSLKAWILGL